MTTVFGDIPADVILDVARSNEQLRLDPINSPAACARRAAAYRATQQGMFAAPRRGNRT